MMFLLKYPFQKPSSEITSTGGLALQGQNMTPDCQSLFVPVGLYARYNTLTRCRLGMCWVLSWEELR